MAPSEPLETLLREAERSALALRDHVKEKQYEALAVTARDLLSAASKLHARAATMAQLQLEGLI